jgi:CRISPR-associated protein Cas1
LQKILAAVETAGLDPFLANLHANQNYRPSLALDLIEEFRLFCVDNVVSRIVNLVQVKPDDFTATAEKGVRMNENTIALLVKEIQARMSSYYFYPREKRKVQLQDILLKQAYQYRDVVLGEQERYEPMIFTY